MSYTAALGYTPIYVIYKDGDDITGHFNDRVTTIKVESKSSGGEGDTIDITLDDRDWLIASPNNKAGSGDRIDLALGYLETGVYSQGDFEIMETDYLYPPKTMRLIGHSLGFTNASKAPIIAAHAGETLDKIIQGIAQAAGVGAAVDPTLGSRAIAYLNQHSSSMHLLQELERRYNGMAHFGSGKLSFTARGTGDSASGSFIGGVAITGEDIATFQISEKNRTSYSKVRGAYWDADKHEKVWLNSTAAPYTDSTVPFMIKRIFATKDEAQAGVDAKMGALNRGFRTGQLSLAKGDPSIRGGSTLVISATRDGVDGSYMIKTATHTYTKDGGIATMLELIDPGTGEDFSEQIDDGNLVRPGDPEPTGSGAS
jgi:hypothetical protein